MLFILSECPRELCGVGVQGRSEKVRGGLEMLFSRTKWKPDLLLLIIVLPRARGTAVAGDWLEPIKKLGPLFTIPGSSEGNRLLSLCLPFFPSGFGPDCDDHKEVSSPTFIITTFMCFGTEQRGLMCGWSSSDDGLFHSSAYRWLVYVCFWSQFPWGDHWMDRLCPGHLVPPSTCICIFLTLFPGAASFPPS